MIEFASALRNLSYLRTNSAPGLVAHRLSLEANSANLPFVYRFLIHASSSMPINSA